MALSMLVLDDHDDLRGAMARLLKRKGFDVTVADSVESARRLSDRYDFGVFDIRLADGDGVDLAGELLEQGRLGRVLFFTGNVDEQAHRRAARLGTVVSKTEGIRSLTEALIQLVARRRASS